MLRNSEVGVILALLCAASMWFYVNHVQIPHQIAYSVVHDAPRGNLSDLYPRWLGARELLLHHRNPYRAEVTREIQRGYYGRELDRQRPGDPIDQQAFAYPVYVAFLLAPSVGLPFQTVRFWFHWFLIAITIVSVWLWLQAIGWKIKASEASIVAILTLGSFPLVQGLKLDQLTLVVAFLVALSASCLAKDRLFLAGVVLAIATIKPQLVAPLLLCLLLWTVSAWTHRQRFFLGFALSMAVLVGSSLIVLPGWLADFRLALIAYRQYIGQSIVDQLLSPIFGQVAPAVALAAVTVIGWHFRMAQPETREFQYMLASTLAATLIVIPMFAPYNQVLLLPAILLIVRDRRELWNKSALSKAALLLTFTAIAWPWAASLALMVGSLWLSPERLEPGWAVPLYTVLTIPMVLLLPLGALVRAAWPRKSIPAFTGCAVRSE